MKEEDQVVAIVNFKDRLIQGHQRRTLARSIRQGAGTFCRGLGR